jgi:hypothetical protein
MLGDLAGTPGPGNRNPQAGSEDLSVRSVGQCSAGSRARENLCRPYGTDSDFRLAQGLRPGLTHSAR